MLSIVMCVSFVFSIQYFIMFIIKSYSHNFKYAATCIHYIDYENIIYHSEIIKTCLNSPHMLPSQFVLLLNKHITSED